MADFALAISLIIALPVIGAIIYAMVKDEDIFEMITSAFFFRLLVLAILFYGVYLGSSLHTHFHSIENTLEKISIVKDGKSEQND